MKKKMESIRKKGNYFNKKTLSIDDISFFFRVYFNAVIGVADQKWKTRRSNVLSACAVRISR